jgi:hypothetical protein
LPLIVGSAGTQPLRHVLGMLEANAPSQLVEPQLQ